MLNLIIGSGFPLIIFRFDVYWGCAAQQRGIKILNSNFVGFILNQLEKLYTQRYFVLKYDKSLLITNLFLRHSFVYTHLVIFLL